MSTYDDFYQSAKEVLSDPDICSKAWVVLIARADPNKPWEGASGSVSELAVSCFYYKPKNGMVNNTVIKTSQKAVLFQCELPGATLETAQWKDAAGILWSIKSVEAVELNDKVIFYKAIIGN